MLQFALWKKLLVMTVIAVGLAYAVPNLLPRDSHITEKGLWQGRTLHFGLDLQGGAHLLMQADMPVVITERMNGLSEQLRLDMRQQKIPFRQLKSHAESVTFGLRNEEDVVNIQPILNALGPDFDVISSDTDFELRFTDAAIQTLNDQTIEQSIEIVRRRIDPDGTKEPVIQRQGRDRILIQLPGVDNPEDIKRLLGKTAKLTFQLVDLRMTASEARRTARTPPGSQLLPGLDESNGSYLVEKRVIVSGEMLDTASAGFDQNNRPAVNFQLNADGGRRFGRVTGENIGRPFAIILDGQVVSAPVIQAQIFSSGQITGDFSIQETQELSLILRAGALPAPLLVLEERSIGPGLGADSVKAGQIACLIGLLAVAGYMSLSYGLFGVFANLALCVNIILIVGALSALQATLTLPGIAGIVLTIGMAVDANVLVFERIREELKLGQKIRAAIDLGYQRALSTILDANLTTLFATLFLYVFGSGPIKGFAVTLSLGIVTSMFTAIMVTRMFIVIWADVRRPKQLVL